ncbi:MAG: 8-amino-7-oxononanoate synthase [Spirochaetales bacterium]|nr:8-amino-7-oxononanoate synthase [Spirochaetales bacterium]
MKEAWTRYIEKSLNKKKEEEQFRELKVLSVNAGREIVIGSRALINFASNNYLGLANDSRVTAAGKTAADAWGSGSGASRLVTGTSGLFTELEASLAVWMKKEKALIFNSGFTANLGLLGALADRDTVVFTDRFNHASIYDGITLSRAQMIRYPHCDADKLKMLLDKHKAERRIIITDTVFSMDGDLAPLENLVSLAHDSGSLLIVDEAHGLGLFGPEGDGLTGGLGLNDGVDIILGTFSKAFGAFGAFVAGSSMLVEYLVNVSRPFIFTTALPPFVLGAVSAALEIIRSEGRGKQVLAMAAGVREELARAGRDTGHSRSQVIPVITGTNREALVLMDKLGEAGLYAPAIRPPTVPFNTARIRVSLSHFHREDDIHRLVEELKP